MTNVKFKLNREMTFNSRLMRSALHLGSGMFGSYAGIFSEEVMRKEH